MLDRLIECENRLLREQKNVNDLLAELGTGKAADEITRMKIEGMQRQIDLLGRQLAVMRAAVQPVQGNAAQMAWQQPPVQPMPTQAQATQPQQIWQGQMMPTQAQAQQQMWQGQPPIQPQATQAQAQQPWQGQQPPQTAQQALYRQNAPRKDFEKTFGKAILPVCASVLIFISFIFFAAIVLPYLGNTVKMVLMYVVSIGIALTGGLLLLRDGRNKGFIALTGCGMGALYLSLILSNLYFRALGDVALYIGLLLWAVAVCVMSRLRSNSFLIIGQIGVNLSVLLGVYLCSGTQDAGKLLFLAIYTLVTQAVFYISHLQRAYNRNIANHIGVCVSLILLAFGVSERYIKGTPIGIFVTVLLLLVLCALVILSITYFRTDEKRSVAFGILNTLYLWTFYALAGYYFETIGLLRAVVAALALVALELRVPGDKHTGKVIFQCALFFQVFREWERVDILKEYVSVSLLAAVCLFYGFYRKNIMYRIAGFLYAILFVIVSMNGFAQLFWCLALGAGAACLLSAFREQYRTWMKVAGYVLFLIGLLEALSRILTDLPLGTWKQNLLTLSVLAAVNIVMTKVPVLRRNLKTGEEERGVRITTGVVQILLTLYCFGCILLIKDFLLIKDLLLPEDFLLHLWAVLAGAVLVCTNSVSLVIREKSGKLGVYVGIKLLVFVTVVLASYEAPGFLISLAGLVVAAACIVFGFAAGRLLGKNFKGIRIYGLIVVMLGIVKLLLFDIYFESALLRAAGLFAGGVLCFAISILYHLLDRRLMGNSDGMK